MKIQNPHDKFFKETFGNVAVTKDFLNNYLPQSITNIVDMNTLEPQKDSFINEELEETFSDLLFRVNINNKEGYLYFLFEHKSYTSRDIAFQLLKYMIEIWEAKIKKEGTNELPIIIPLVIYHGKDNWNVKTNFGEMINGYEELPKDIQKHIPNYEYLLYDISKYTDEEIKGGARNKIIMTTLRDIPMKDINGIIDSVLRMAEYLAEIEDKQTGIEYFEILMRYVFSARVDLTTKDANKIINEIGNIYPEGSEVVMTLAEKFREEGMEKGREEGIMKGMERGIEVGARKRAIEVAKKLIKMGLSINQIVDATELPNKEVEKLAKEMNN